jgi:hypothetical protein
MWKGYGVRLEKLGYGVFHKKIGPPSKRCLLGKALWVGGI